MRNSFRGRAQDACIPESDRPLLLFVGKPKITRVEPDKPEAQQPESHRVINVPSPFAGGDSTAGHAWGF
jgi:hypothetical protein